MSAQRMDLPFRWPRHWERPARRPMRLLPASNEVRRLFDALQSPTPPNVDPHTVQMLLLVSTVAASRDLSRAPRAARRRGMRLCEEIARGLRLGQTGRPPHAWTRIRRRAS